MNAIDIIKGMCQNGNTEQMGVFSPIGDIDETFKNYFGEEYYCIAIHNEMYDNCDYLYVYGERLPNDTGIATKADFILANDKKEFIYIYEIENI